MKNIQIVASGSYLPNKEITNQQLAKQFGITDKEILEKTGIQKRFYHEKETIEELAKKAVEKLFVKYPIDKTKIGMIIVATTTTTQLMPGISYFIQKELNIPNSMCLDILAGCSGYINAFDIARNYIALGKIEYALVIGCEILSDFTDKQDYQTALLFADGAGATLIGKTTQPKQYASFIESKGEKGEILTCQTNSKIYMEGKAVYKYAVTDTVKNVQQLLEQQQEKMETIKYIIPHQSNIRILEKITEKLQVPKEKMMTNIEQVGNTFCASIPILLDEMLEKGMLQDKDKILLLGYGGGLNLGSILMEV